MIPDTNVSATFWIRVTEDYYSQLSSVLWLRELMKVLRLAANNIAEWVLVEQQKGWVLWVTVSVGYVCYSRLRRSCKGCLQKGTKWCKVWAYGKENKGSCKKNSDNNIFKGNFSEENTNWFFFSIPDNTLLIACILRRRITWFQNQNILHIFD